MIKSLDFIQSKNILLSASEDDYLGVWDLSNKVLIKKLKVKVDLILVPELFNYFFIVSFNFLKILDKETYELIRDIKITDKFPENFALSYDNRYIANSIANVIQIRKIKRDNIKFSREISVD